MPRQAEYDDSRALRWWIRPDIGEVEVKREQHASLFRTNLGDPWICCASESLVLHRQCVMACLAELSDTLNG